MTQHWHFDFSCTGDTIHHAKPTLPPRCWKSTRSSHATAHFDSPSTPVASEVELYDDWNQISVGLINTDLSASIILSALSIIHIKMYVYTHTNADRI